MVKLKQPLAPAKKAMIYQRAVLRRPALHPHVPGLMTIGRYALEAYTHRVING